MEAYYQGQQGQQMHMDAGGHHDHQGGRQMNSMGDTSMLGGDSLDDIIRDNQNELQRRRSIPQPYHGQLGQDGQDRRLSMMEFGGSNDSYRNYTFPSSGMSNDFSNMGNNMSMAGPMDDFSNHDVMQMPAATNFTPLSSDLMGNMMPATFANMNMSPISHEQGTMNMFDPSAMGGQFAPDTLNTAGQDYSMDMGAEDGQLDATPRNAANPLTLDARADVAANTPQAFPSADDVPEAKLPQPKNPSRGTASISPSKPELSRELSSNSVESAARASALTTPQTPISQSTGSAATTPGAPATSRGDSKEKTVYSKSGFDMLRALWYVATRKNPEIHLGAVDMSCAFVVCDVSLNDCPIIYVSDNFQNLTGYSRHEIVGQNCRFLQAPDGNVEAGSKREFVDDGAVYNLKKKIAEGKEVQQSLINYRKGGKPFLNLLTMIPIPWDDPDEIRFFVGFQIDLVECPDAIASGQEVGGVKVNYKHSDIGQYIWTPPTAGQFEPDNGQTLGVDDVSTLLQQFNPKGSVSDWHKQSWDKMLLENTDDVVHVLSLKGLFLYLSPSCKRVLEYDAADLVGNSLSTVCHPSDIVPVTRELKDTSVGNPVNIVFRIRRKQSGYTWFESYGSLFVEQGKGRKCIILVGRKRPVFALSRRDLEANGGIGDSELWSKISTSGMFLFVSSNIRSLLDLQPENLVGTSIQELMRRESRAEFGRSIEKARRGKIVTCKHEVHNRRGQVLQAQTILYPGDASEGQKPTFLLAQTKLLKASSRAIAPATSSPGSVASTPAAASATQAALPNTGLEVSGPSATGAVSTPAGSALMPGTQDAALASDDNIFEELRTTKCSSWQFELRQMEKVNRILAEELGGLLSNKKKRKRRKGVGNVVRDCANCHTRNTPEWRRGPSGQRDLCNSCGLRWAKQTGRVSPRNSSRGGNGDAQSKQSNSPVHTSPLQREFPTDASRGQPNDGDPNAGNYSTPTGSSKTHSSMPPPSQPLLEGGSGVDITSIQEERETSQS